jgi:DNA-binding response OmpR family regulator
MAARILIVDDDDSIRGGLEQLLGRAGYDTLTAATFEEGRRLLSAEPIDLLLVDVRLGPFNGLHLVARKPDSVPAIVITGVADTVLEGDAGSLGAHFLLKPVSPPELMALVEQTLRASGHQPVRRWVRKQVPDALPAAVDHTPARILEVSYGGLRFEMEEQPEQAPGSPLSVRVPESDVAVQVDLVWQSRTMQGHWVCGAMLSEANQAEISAWRGLVDAIG